MTQLGFLDTSATGEARVRKGIGADSRTANEATPPWQGIAPEALAAHEEREEQRSEQKRVVSSGLEAAVLKFCRQVGAGAVFRYADQLADFCDGLGFQFETDSLRKMLSILEGKGIISYTTRRGTVTLHTVSHVEATR